MLTGLEKGLGPLFEVAVTGITFAQTSPLGPWVRSSFSTACYRAGRKSMGYSIVVFGTPSLAPKLNFFTLSTIWAENSVAFILLDSTAQAETAPLGSIAIRSTIFPRR